MLNLNYQDVIKNFPKQRSILPEEYLKIYDEHYMNNRNGTTPASFWAMQMEKWLHKKVAATALKAGGGYTLEVGGDIKST